jgi:hypothetical protein
MLRRQIRIELMGAHVAVRWRFDGGSIVVNVTTPHKVGKNQYMSDIEQVQTAKKSFTFR